MKKVTIFTLMLMLFASIGFSQTAVSYDFSDGGAVTGLNEASPGIALDANIGFGSFKNGGTANPALNSGQVRLYQNATKGGSIKIYAINGVTITQVVVHASGTTGPAAYTVDGGSEINLSNGTTYTMSSLSATSVVEFYQKDASSSNRIYVDDFEVTYTTGGGSSVPAPVFTPTAGTYYGAQSVTIAVSEPGKTEELPIYYTTDGTTVPDNTSTLYTGAIPVASTTTIKAVTYDEAEPSNVDMDEYSAVTTAIYTIVETEEASTIADLRAEYNAAKLEPTVYDLSGEAIITFIRTDNRNQKFIEDATGAILIDDASGIITASLNIGDGLTGLTGTLSEYKNMMQFTPVIDPGAASSTGNPVIPTVVDPDVFMANFEDYEAQLIQFSGVEFDDAGGTFAQYTLYDVASSSDDGVVTTRFKSTEVDYIPSTIPSGLRDVVGLAYHYNSDIGIAPRTVLDMAAAAPTPPPAVPVSSKGIIIAGLLIGLVVVVRKGRLF